MSMKDIVVHWAGLDLLPIAFVIMFCVIMISVYRLRKTIRIIDLLIAGNVHLLLHYSFIKKVIKYALLCNGVAFLLIALLRPQWNTVEAPIPYEGRDLLIALDISRSMLAQDLQPDRLMFAKQKIKELVKQLDSERVGLMLFSGSPFVQCPLTEDVGAFLMFLDAIDVETISSGTTALDEAIRKATDLFTKMAERKNKLLIIFTDGEDFSSNLTAVKKKAAQIGLHIITVGVGTAEGAPIPLYDRQGKQIGHQLDDKGNVVISRMNEDILHRLAEDTGGLFVPIEQSNHDLKVIQQFVSSFEKELLNDKHVKHYQEQYQWPLLASFISLAVEWLL